MSAFACLLSQGFFPDIRNTISIRITGIKYKKTLIPASRIILFFVSFASCIYKNLKDGFDEPKSKNKKRQWNDHQNNADEYFLSQDYQILCVHIFMLLVL